MAPAQATLIPLANGVAPAEIFGDPTESRVLAVPDDLVPAPRPEHEILIELPSGAMMPANGLGMCCRPTAYDTLSVRRTVLWYLLKGGRLIDTAQLYLNHKAVGLGIADAIARGVPRSEIYVVTKLTPRDYAGSNPTDVIPKFMEELQVDYIDLVYLHHPQGMGLGVCASGTANCNLNGHFFD